MKFLIFVLGASVGSFLYVLKDFRLPGKSIFRKRSSCDHCHQELYFYDMIPLFSYWNLGGHCRFCHAKIPFLSFLTEFVGGLFFLLVFPFPLGICSLLVWNFSLLLLMSYTDLQTHHIGNAELFLLLVSNLSYFIWRLVSSGTVPVFSLLFCLTVLFICYVTKEKYFGLGDAQLLFLMSLLFSTYGFIRYFYLLILPAGIYALYLLGKGHRKEELPLVPFFLLAFILQWVFPTEVLL